MYFADSKSFFEISNGLQLDNTLQARLLCLKDFLKRCALFPVALLAKACKTALRGLGVFLGAGLIAITMGSSASARRFFVSRVAGLAKDLADWLLLPFALVGCFFRLLFAFLIHPNVYFNALS